MYSLDLIKKTQLAKKLGGPPIFHDGFIHAIIVTKETMTLDIQILSQNNPSLREDTRVMLKLNGIHSFALVSTEITANLMIIHDLEIRKENQQLHMILESATGEVSDIVFTSIELSEA